MVIMFMDPRPLNHLLEKGHVYTLRSKEHKTGRDWMNDGRGRTKINDIWIECINDNISIWDLGEYVRESGFDNYREWLETYCKLNNNKMLKKRIYLYKVNLYHYDYSRNTYGWY